MSEFLTMFRELRKHGFSAIQMQDVAENLHITTEETIELVLNGFSEEIVPVLAKTYDKSRDAEEAIQSFHLLMILGIDVKIKNGSRILLSAAEFACSFDLNRAQRTIVKGTLNAALEPAIRSFKKHHEKEVKTLIKEL